MVWPSRKNNYFPFHVRANKIVPRGENPSYPHHAYAPSSDNNNVSNAATIEALKEAYKEMVSICELYGKPETDTMSFAFERSKPTGSKC